MAVIHSIIGHITTQTINFGIDKVFFFCPLKDLLAIVGSKEFTPAVEQFQSIPLTRIVTGGQDDPSVRLQPCDCQFGSRCCSRTYIGYVKPHTHKCSADNLTDHFA